MGDKTVLMTGATGFLGSNLLKSLVLHNYQVSILKRQTSSLHYLTEYTEKITAFNLEEISIEDCFQKVKPEIVIHCATDYGRSNTSPSAIVDTNLILPLRLIEISKKNKVKCFINTDTFLDKKINHYSLSKKQFTDWFKTFSSDLICANITLEHFYGPKDHKSKFVSFIIDKFLTLSTEINLTLGEQKRDFIFIDDVVNAYLLVLDSISNKSNGFYNFEIGTNTQITIKDLVETIRNLTENKTTKVNYGAIPYRENELMESKVNTELIRALGWFPKVELIDGLLRTINAEKK
jgi:nucleoside-diphosphate-sugar epimerase